MTDATNFSELVKEAFITPIRSVLIVDDQYPTWDEILGDAASTPSKAKEWTSNKAAPLGVIKQFRSRKPGLVIDIHDGQTPDDEQADHLHQSDLLVLDYNLENTTTGLRGEKARQILRSVLVNRHFNLVIVHTGEDNLKEVFFDCLISNMTSCTSQYTDRLKKNIIALEPVLDGLIDSESLSINDAVNHIDLDRYLAVRKAKNDGEIRRLYMSPDGALSQLRNYAQNLELEEQDKKRKLDHSELNTFVYWVIREFEKNKLSLFSDQTSEGLLWSTGLDNIWFRTSKGFVTFVEKGPEDLLGSLQMALEDWRPTPSRLISAKYRHELSSSGVQAEDRTLSRSHVFAHFYKDFCAPANSELTDDEAARLRKAKLKEHVARQSESITFHIEDAVIAFGEQIRKVDEARKSQFSDHYSLDLSNKTSAASKKATAHYNSYVSTLPIKKGEDQLDSGHIFKIDGEWWVCATPACDLQPGQNTLAFKGKTSTHRPFTALRLEGIGSTVDPLETANTGLNCFIEQAPGDVICLKLSPHENGKVNWRTLIAEGNGCIKHGKMQLKVLQFDSSGIPELSTAQEAKFVAKLRYEYALNYIQRIGISTSRIGLGYSSG